MQSAKLIREHNVSNVCEINISWNGFCYLTIYGKHASGWFIAIPNHSVIIDSSEPEDTIYNGDKLAKALDCATAGTEIARLIKEHWEGRVNGNDN